MRVFLFQTLVCVDYFLVLNIAKVEIPFLLMLAKVTFDNLPRFFISHFQGFQLSFKAINVRKSMKMQALKVNEFFIFLAYYCLKEHFISQAIDLRYLNLDSKFTCFNSTLIYYR